MEKIMNGTDLKSIMVGQGQLNNCSLEQLDNDSIANMIKGVFKSVSTSLNNEYIVEMSKQINVMNKELGKLKSNIKIMQKDHEEMGVELESAKKIIDDLTEKTGTLEFSDSSKVGDIKRQAKMRVMHFTGINTEPEYILFFRPYIANLYSNISNNLCGGKRIGQIKEEDYETAKTLAKRWSPTEKLRKRLIDNYIKKQSKGILEEVKDRALDLYLEQNEGY